MAVMAGPDEVTQPFISDTVSMIDFGVFRLQNRIDSFIGLPLTYASYDWERNLVIISGWVSEGE